MLNNINETVVDVYGKSSAESRHLLSERGITLNLIQTIGRQNVRSRVCIIHADLCNENPIELCIKASKIYRLVYVINVLDKHLVAELSIIPKNVYFTCESARTGETLFKFTDNVEITGTAPIRPKTGIIPDVSIICANMGRETVLRANLQSWLANESVNEIVIVDWGNKGYLYDLPDIDSRIHVIAAMDQNTFNISQAYNLALFNASRPHILKMDCDYYLNPYYDFFTSHPLQPGMFYSGCWHAVENSDLPKPVFQHLSGCCFAWKDDLLAVNGYNEAFEGYGFDDTDLHKRLIKNGVTRHIINFDYSIIHIPHSHASRVENYIVKSPWNAAGNKEISRNSGNKPPRLKTWSLERLSPRFTQAYEINLSL